MEVSHPHMEAFVAKHKLTKLATTRRCRSAEANKPPQPTHICEGPGTHRELDHLLIRLPDGVRCETPITSLLEHSGTSDHKPVLSRLTLHNYNYAPSPPRLPTCHEPRLVTPIPIAKLEAYKNKVQQTMSPQLALLHQLTLATRTQLVELWEQSGGDYKTVADALKKDGEHHHITEQHREAGRLLTEVTATLNNVAKDTLEYYTPGAAKKHYLPRRTQAVIRRKLKECRYLQSLISTTKEHLQAVNDNGDKLGDHTEHCELYLKLARVHAVHSNTRQAMDVPPQEYPDDQAHAEHWLAKLTTMHHEARKAMWMMKQQHKRTAISNYQTRWRRVLATQPKKGYKRIFDNESAHGANATACAEGDDIPTNLSFLRNPYTGKVTGDPTDVKRVVTDFFRKQQTSVDGPRSGNYGDSTPRNYPFERQDAVDPYKLEPRPGMDRETLSKDMTNDILHGGLFATVLNRAGKHKAPGPDGVPYELIKHGGELLHKCLEQYMVGIWFTTEHPWPNSNTALLYKKHDPLEVKNYRPIGLTNTMYKLWTAMLTEVMSVQAEHYQILSTCQEGFRPYRNTIRQLGMVINALEDARMFSQDIMLLFVDFTSAFNTIDHDKLLQIMFDMGFPEIAIDNVRGIYQSATTSIITPHGPTAPIPIERGTIQGDTLSPFLFLVFMEPLLRWLYSGGRGYKFGCLTPALKHLHQCVSPTFADDLLCMTHDTPNLQVQADKVTAYCNWANMAANATKCGVTGIRYCTEGKQQSNPTSTRAVASLRRSLQRVSIQGRQIPFHHPDTAPYDYLGVPLTATLNYRWYYEKVVEKLKDKADKLNRSFASGPQRLRAIEQCLIPSAAYGFPLAPLGTQEIQRLDAIIAKVAKQAYNLPNSMPSRMVHLARREGGLGVESLRAKFYRLNLATLVKSLNDDGTLGVVTRSLLNAQTKVLHGLHVRDVPSEAKHLRLAKQLAMTAEAGLELTSNGSPYHEEVSDIVSRLKQVKYDPKALGLREAIPARVYRHLMQLGITTLVDLTCEGGTHMIPASALQRRYGHLVNHRHKRALNTLTMLLNSHAADGLTMPNVTTTADLDRPHRKIHYGHIAVELATTTEGGLSKAARLIERMRHGDKATMPPQSPTTDKADQTRCSQKPASKRTKHSRPVTPDPDFGLPDWVQRMREERPREPLTGELHQWDAVSAELLKDRSFTRYASNRRKALRNSRFSRGPSIKDTQCTIAGTTYYFEANGHMAHDESVSNPSCTDGMPTVPPRTQANSRHGDVGQPTHQARPTPQQPEEDFVHITPLQRCIITYNRPTQTALQALYGDHAVPTAFLAERVGSRQRQLLVKWEPTIIMKQHLEAWAALGYTPHEQHERLWPLRRAV